ncbi:MAG: hypothetical protein A2889_09460 [Nitrospinae bacterium RIFCSPLOWO2_01_FULL_39_10]|nr:MAG: hypothetical protein A2889_09460 [Nitrospinae bacterium RIFCSPLOWO2_01_FULL_39_10]
MPFLSVCSITLLSRVSEKAGLYEYRMKKHVPASIKRGTEDRRQNIFRPFIKSLLCLNTRNYKKHIKEKGRRRWRDGDKKQKKNQDTDGHG